MKALIVGMLLLAAQILAPPPSTLQGTVVDAVTGVPIPRAVVVIGMDFYGAKGYSTVTDRDGRFVFADPDLVPGNYRIRANGGEQYLPTEFEQRMQDRPGIAYPLGFGASQVQLKLTPLGAISGRVLDSRGEPLGNATVSANCLATLNGSQALRYVQSVTSNDRGEYRLFWLPPGSYLVRVEPPVVNRMGREFGASSGGEMSSHAMAIWSTRPAVTSPPRPEIRPSGDATVATYYPNAMHVQSASRIELKAGQEKSGIDIVAGRMQPPKVRLTVVSGMTNQAITDAQVSAWPAMATSSIPFDWNAGSGAYLSGDFQLGNYVISGKTSSGLEGQINMEVVDADIETRLVLWPNLDIKGIVQLEGKTLGNESISTLRPLLFRLQPDFNGGGVGPYLQKIEDDGSFLLNRVVRGVSYRVALDSMFNLYSHNAYIKSLRLDGKDVSNGLRLDAAQKGPLQIVIAGDGGRLEGRVLTADLANLQPAVNVSVVAVPASRRRLDLYRNTYTDRSGRFQLQGLAPGDYKVFAWEQIEAGAWQVPETLRKYESEGTPLQIRSSSIKTVSLTAIPGK